MTRSFALAALAAAALATSPMLTSEASAKDVRRGNAVAIGIAAGIGGVLLGSAIANAQPRYHAEPSFHAEPRRFHAEPRYFGTVSYGGGQRYVDQPECFRKPVNRIDRFTGEIVTVGVRTICR